MPSPAPQPGAIERLNRELCNRLPAFLMSRRWFGGKARAIRSTEVTDAVPIRADAADAVVLFVRVSYVDATAESYVLPLPSAGVAAPDAPLSDAFENSAFLAAVWLTLARDSVFTGTHGAIRATRAPGFPSDADAPGAPSARVLSGEQSNTSVIYGGRFIFKFFRRAQPGINPDLEMGTFLTANGRFPHVPPVVGSLHYRGADGAEITLGILQGFVPNQGDAWRYALAEVAAYYAQVSPLAASQAPPLPASDVPAPRQQPPPRVRELLGGFLDSARLLGRRTAELHLALSSDSSDPSFAPEPFTSPFQREFEQRLRELTEQVFSLFRLKREGLSPAVRAAAASLLDREPEILDRFHAALARPIGASRTRIHGDYHLGQVLWTGSDFVIIDFEGEPARPLPERRAKRSPLQDVAGMLRSFHYAAISPLLDPRGRHAAADRERLLPWAAAWSRWSGSQFLSQYLETASGAAFLPSGGGELASLLDLYLLQKAIYELGYELNNRPDWIEVPLAGIHDLLKSR